MPKASPILNAFNAGEWSPKLEGRVDQEKYYSACKELEGFIPQVHGSVEKRPGFRHVSEVKDSADTTILIPFQFSTEQAYILEFGDSIMRVYKDGGIVETGPSTPYELISPSLPVKAMLPTLQYAQSADVLYLAHEDLVPIKIERASDTSWSVTQIDFAWPPFSPENSDESATIYASAQVGSVTLTASSAIFDSSMIGSHVKLREIIASNHDEWATGTVYAANTEVRFGNNVYLTVAGGTSGTRPPVHDAGTVLDDGTSGVLWTYRHSGEGYAEITFVSSPGAKTTATATVVEVLPASTVGSSNATFRYALGAWSGSSTKGYPRTVTFFEDRLVWAGTPGNPQTVWGSKTGDYENHKTGTNDDDAYSYTINSDQVNAIQWMSAEKVLLIGTVGGEFSMRASSLSEAITPTNVRVSQETQFGSAAQRAVRVGNSTLFVQRSGKKVRELKYSFDDDAYVATDLTLLAEHIGGTGITSTAYQSQPNQVLWAVRADGVLLGFTYERQEQVYGWHRHPLGGTDAKVKSVAVIPHPDGDQDQLWAIIERTIDGSTVQYVEYMEKAWDRTNDIEDAFYVDSGLTYDGSPVTSVSGLDHLEGETVTILADGAAHPDKVVVSGSITLDRSASVVHAGLGYYATLLTMRLEQGAADGTAQGKTKRIHNSTVRLDQTGPGLWFGPDTTNMDEINFRDATMAMDTAVPLFDGDKGPLPWPGGYEQEGRIAMQHRLPLPCSILCIMPQLVTQDR